MSIDDAFLVLLDAAEHMCKTYQPSEPVSPTSQTQQPTPPSTPEPKMITKKDGDENTQLFEETLNFNETTSNPNDVEKMLMKKEMKVVANKTEPSDVFITSLPTTTIKASGMVPITGDLPEAEEEERTSLTTRR